MVPETLHLSPDLLAALRSGDAILDSGARGPAPELVLLRDAGLLIAPLPFTLGGRGWGMQSDGALPMLGVLTGLGSASLPIARIYEGHVNAVRLVVRNGSVSQQARVARAVRDGAIMGVWGADSAQLVRIEPTTTGDVLCGIKAFASGLGDVTLALVTAKTDDGLQMLLIDATDTERCDPARWDMDGMVGSRSGHFDCTGLAADEDRRIGGPNAILAEPDFHGGIWRLAACYSGAMLEIAKELAALIDQRGLADDAIMRHRLGLAALEAQGSVLWARQACLSAETGTDIDQMLGTVLFAREAIEMAADRQMALAERIGGTSLHQRESALGRTIRDLRLYLRQAQLDGKLALAVGCWHKIGNPNLINAMKEAGAYQPDED